MKTPIRFVTSVYGKKYGGMLLNLLYSVVHSNPEAAITVFWQDVGDSIKDLKDAFPQVNFINTEKEMGVDSVSRIANKTQLWTEAALLYKGENLAFVDVDMLVLKDVSHFFVDKTFDVLFTYKDEIYPINTGTVLIRASQKVVNFFTIWTQETMNILSDNELKKQATSRSYPYGAPDQMAFYRLLNFSLPQETYAVSGLVIKGVPCALLNETNSKPVHTETHIIHYKGGWHSILIDGTDFTFRRPKPDSWEMYLLYLRTYKEAVAYVSKRLNKKFSNSSFGVTIPFYLDNDLCESKFLYAVFNLCERILVPVRKVIRFIRKRLRSGR